MGCRICDIPMQKDGPEVVFEGAFALACRIWDMGMQMAAGILPAGNGRWLVGGANKARGCK